MGGAVTADETTGLVRTEQDWQIRRRQFTSVLLQPIESKER